MDLNGSDQRVKFCIATVKRCKKIYKKWFYTLKLYSNQILKNDKRYSLFKEIQEQLPQAKVYYVDGARQFPIRCKWDWLRPWLSVGIKTQSDFVSVASNGNSIEVGLRRLPENTNIDGKDIWYRHDHCVNFEFGTLDLADQLIQKLDELLKETPK